MSDKLEEALVEAIGKATGAAEAAGSFLAAELPDVIEQLLMWKLVESAIQGLLPLTLLVAYGVFLKVSWTRANSSDHRFWDVEDFFVSGGICGCVALFILVWLGRCVMTCAQILIAPKVYLIEYAARMAS